MNEGEHLIVLLHKSKLEHQEICASDWFKPISTLLTHIHFGSLCFIYIPNLALHYKQLIYNSSVSRVEEHLIDNGIGNFIVSHFYPSVSRFYRNLRGKNGTSFKTIFLISENY